MDGGLPCGGHAAVASLSPLLFPRDLGAPLARLGKADRDRLLPALDLPAGAAASERAGFALLHRALDLSWRRPSNTSASSLSWPCRSPLCRALLPMGHEVEPS